MTGGEPLRLEKRLAVLHPQAQEPERGLHLTAAEERQVGPSPGWIQQDLDLLLDRAPVLRTAAADEQAPEVVQQYEAR